MFKTHPALVGDMLSKDTLPESLVTRCLDVLRELATNERDLIRIVVEVILELRDFGDDDEEPAPRQVWTFRISPSN